jgi:hypothetical protein
VLGVEPGPGLRELHRQILAGDVPAVPHRAVLAAPAPVPRQLPADAIHFTGRAAELDQLDGALGTSLARTLLITAVTGTAGVGKTALAIRWAHQVAGRFPDGQLYVNLRPQKLFLDPRLDRTATMTLPTIPPSTSTATLPNTGQFPEWFVPNETSSLTVRQTSTIPAMFDIGAGAGDPHVHRVGDLCPAGGSGDLWSVGGRAGRLRPLRRPCRGRHRDRHHVPAGQGIRPGDHRPAR